MEKYIVCLFLLALLLFALCTLPIVGYTADNTYAVCPKAAYAECVLGAGPTWQTQEYVVFLLDSASKAKAKTIPHAKVVQEYIFNTSHTLPMCNPFLQAVQAGGITTVGFPYVIAN